RRQEIVAGLRSNRIARSREFASVLHSEHRLKHVLRDIEGALASDAGADPAGPGGGRGLDVEDIRTVPGLPGGRDARSGSILANLLYFPPWIAAAPSSSTYNENEAPSGTSKRAPVESDGRTAPRASKSQYGRFHETRRIWLAT